MSCFNPVIVTSGYWSILSKHVRHVIIILCFFFNVKCSKVIGLVILDDYKRRWFSHTVKLRCIFPPSFFDIMLHLVIYLLREIKLCRSINLRWIHPFEWYMKNLKRLSDKSTLTWGIYYWGLHSWRGCWFLQWILVKCWRNWSS